MQTLIGPSTLRGALGTLRDLQQWRKPFWYRADGISCFGATQERNKFVAKIIQSLPSSDEIHRWILRDTMG